MSLRDVDAPSEAQVSLEGPGPQRRVTVFFRVILAIPHILYALVLGIVGFFAVVVTWFAALVLGRVPDGLHGFLTGILDYITRVYGYAGYLLTDRYPSFSLHAEGEAVAVLVPPPGRLNRAAVLFRLILMVPAFIVASVAGSGVSIALFFIWLIVLITGRMPRSLFEALAVVLRYQVRAHAYFAMLTSEYPRGLFGDAEAPSATVPDASPPPPVGAPTTGLPAMPRITRLVLSKAGKRLVILFLVLGAITSVGTNAARIANTARANRAADRVEAQHADLEAALRRFSTAIQGCGLSGGPSCVHAADRDLADALGRFRRTLADTKYPAGAIGAARSVETDADDVIAVLGTMATTSDSAEYQRLATQFQQLGTAFDQDYASLIDILRLGRVR